MRGYWSYYHYFNKEQCETILNESLKFPERDGNVGNGFNGDNLPNVRNSKIRFVGRGESKALEFMFEDLWKLAIHSNAKYFDFHLTKLEYVQIAEYDASYLGEYKKHQDVTWLNETPYHRKLSCIIQLTDPDEYEGGNFELCIREQPVPNQLRKQGTVIFFPSFIEHQAHPVTKGKRYSVAGWFEGPKWR
jgi:PKHD-type hydroxylase